MPPDNSSPIAADGAVEFPLDGPNSGAITRTDSSTFALANPGAYRVSFSVPVIGAGQLELTLNGTPLAFTVVGRATGTTSIAGESLFFTDTPGEELSVVNPTGNSTIAVTQNAGGTHPVSASLIIEQLQ